MSKLDQNFVGLERRESQLWWVAVTVIMILACAVSIVDWISAVRPDGSDPFAAVDVRSLRVALVLGALAMSAYFRGTASRLRRLNNALVIDLQARSEELQHKNAEVSKLKELSDELISLTNLPKALNLALDMAVDVIGADTASIMLREGDSDVLSVVAARGLPEEVVRNARVRLGDSLAGMVAERGEAVILNSDELENGLRDRAHRINELVSAIIVPVRVDSEVRGVINISKRRGGPCFTDDDLRVLSTLANQTALVLRKIELWEDLQEQVIKLQQALADLKRTQAELIHSEKLASIGQLAGGIAHEINNPLQVIRGRVELMLREFPGESVHAKHLNTVLSHVDRIASIVSGLLRFSRRQPEEEQDPVLIDEAVRDAVSLLGNQLQVSNVKLEMDLGCAGQVVMGSRVKLQQVFMNLILNAYQAMEATGGQLAIRSRPVGHQLRLTFSDTGPGIPEEHLPHIFEPFFSTKPEGQGTGLGLSVTYGIVESHGGRIEVQSEPGRGTTFTITFPAGRGLAKAA